MKTITQIIRLLDLSEHRARGMHDGNQPRHSGV